MLLKSSGFKSWKFNKLVFIIILSIFLVCSCTSYPSQSDSAELLRDGLNIYCVRTNLSLSDINRTMGSINFSEDPLVELKILQAKMNQFRIFAKPDIFMYIAKTKTPLRNQIVPPEFWAGGGSDIPEIYSGVTYVSNSVVKTLIDKLEKKEALTEQHIITWEKTQRHFSVMVDNFKGIDGNYEDMADSSKIEAVQHAVHNAKILREINL
jgi:hypothetical protein